MESSLKEINLTQLLCSRRTTRAAIQMRTGRSPQEINSLIDLAILLITMITIAQARRRTI
jgi:hypothetical protein